MCICTRLTCAVELAGLPNNRTKPNNAIKVLRLTFLLLILLTVIETTRVQRHEWRKHTRIERALTSRHTSAQAPLDQECEMLNIFGIGVLFLRRLPVVSWRNTLERYCLRHHHRVCSYARLRRRVGCSVRSGATWFRTIEVATQARH